MNRIYFITIFSLLILTTNSCQERNFLGPDQQEIDSNDYFTNELAFDRAVLGVYQKLVFFYNYRGGSENWLHDIRLLPDDDATTTGGNAFEIFGNLTATNGNLSAYYQFAYQLIGRANTVLQKQDELGDLAYEDIDLRATHRGEILFLRGYMNFMLWNVFGTAPLVLDRITSAEDFYPPNSSGNELLDQAIADFSEARDLLPDSWPAELAGRATRNAANGFLGKALLYRATVSGNSADYTAAIAAFDQVQGASLLPVYGDNFDEKLEEGAESIFEIHLGRNEQTDNVWLTNDDFNV
ncbi:MAG: RagB/SusD family nutrient uptake outer membrane protein, partial [Bacteroidetes bacterium]|nr:RagB/SusD family nutrient uptake outer membrane protein [Bacteroidota bacterium]